MDKAFLLDLFEPFGPIRIKRMFGMQGVFADELMIGFAGEDALYLKTDKTTRSDYETEGCGPFIYSKRTGEGIAMSYWRVPERLFDDPEELACWARKAHAVAQRGPTAARKRKAALKPKNAKKRVSASR